MKCELCNQQAIYYHGNHKTGKLENLCKFHYSIWHESFVVEDVKKMKNCFVCKDKAKTIEHHFSYLPQIIIYVCEHCHKKIHKEKNSVLCPSHRHAIIFHSGKGHIKKYVKGMWRYHKLTEKEKWLRKEMLRGGKKYLVN